jgi:hypothetical protein
LSPRPSAKAAAFAGLPASDCSDPNAIRGKTEAAYIIVIHLEGRPRLNPRPGENLLDPTCGRFSAMPYPLPRFSDGIRRNN